MKRTKQKLAPRAILFGVVALSFSACASAPTPAPVVYAKLAPSTAAAGRAPSQEFASAAWSRTSPVDLTAIPFDADTAPRILSDAPPSECVPYARAVSGIDIRGDAVTWWRRAEGLYARSRHPGAGSVLVMRGYNDSTRGHVSVVKAVVSDRMLRVDHANWMNGGEVSLDVPVIDVSPNNDWSEVRVWHIPGGYWGGRTYEAEGFIHPVGLVAGSSSSG